MPGMPIEVNGTVMQDIIDIRPPLRPPEPGPAWWWYAAGALVLVLALMLLWRVLRRQRRATEEPAIPPHELAVGELDRLERDQPGPKDFYFRLTAIVRGYIEGRFGVAALEMTSEEFLPALERLKGQSLDPDIADGVRAMVRRSDPVKYAGQAASGQAMAEDLALARDLVRRTLPKQSDQNGQPEPQADQEPDHA